MLMTFVTKVVNVRLFFPNGAALAGLNTDVTSGKSNKIKQKLAITAPCSSLTYSECVSESCHYLATMGNDIHYKVNNSTRPSLV